jgi:exosortase/archaeosortase family protein
MVTKNANQALYSVAVEGLEFLLKMAVVAGLLFILFQPVELILQRAIAQLSQNVLEMLGTIIIQTSNPIQFFADNYKIEISPLCSGLLEVCLLAGAVMATKGKKWKSKLKGIVVGIVLLQTFNVIRITATIMQLNHTSIEFATFTHDVLFRIVLLIGFAILYGAWLYFPQLKKKLTMKGVL